MESTARKRGRPKGTKNAPGHAAGRPPQKAPDGRDLAAEQADIAKWWPTRPGGKPSGYEVGRRLEVSETYIRRFMKEARPANVLQIENMQRMLEAYGYECPTNHHLFL